MTKELRRCVSTNRLLGLITREQEAVLTDRRTAILKIMEDIKKCMLLELEQQDTR